MKALSEHKKQKEYLVCVDSDGCAMDTMDIKHFRCFGPCMVEEWGLQQWQESILTRWNVINLYSITRGINRFRGLAKTLAEINTQYCPIEGIETLVAWAENSPELSNAALGRAIAENPDAIVLKKALAWSVAVNKSITQLPNEAKIPFPGVGEALALAHTVADVAIVSSANLDAVLEEWTEHGLLEHVDVILSQNDGSKAHCIAELCKLGYDKNNVLMCGDAPGDLRAAEENNVYFYPILVRREKESWQEFSTVALTNLTSNGYGGNYQEAKTNAFFKNLGE